MICIRMVPMVMFLHSLEQGFVLGMGEGHGFSRRKLSNHISGQENSSCWTNNSIGKSCAH